MALITNPVPISGSTHPVREAWYKEWFDREEYELVYQERDEDEAVRLVRLIEQTVHPEPGARVLDMARGRGRHARVLARRGYRVTGVDLSRRAVLRAEQDAEAEGLSIRFIRADMREPVGRAEYDGVVNLFTAFGYFEKPEDHHRALQSMVEALKPGGWFVQDYLNAPYVLHNLRPEDQRTEGSVHIVQRRWVENDWVNKTIRLERGSETYTFRESVRLFTLDDFRQMYAAVGLETQETFGDYDGRPHSPEAPRLILFARKRSLG